MKSKKCIKCQKIRLVKFFNKRKTSKDGLRNSCKSCEAKKCKEYYFSNKEAIIEWKKKNQTKIQKYQQDYYPKYREKNKEKIIKYKKQYQTKNRDKINAKINKKYKEDINYRIKHNLRTRLNLAIKNNSKHSSTIILLGCSIKKFKEHIEKQFTHNMSWNNYGQWHLDHIKPCASFDLSKKEEQKICFHYSNFQPLWAKDNLIKGRKVFNA
jgi:hypothetical protein